MITRIAVDIQALSRMADLVCEIDFANAAGNKSEVTGHISAIHSLIEQALGVHADKVYLPEQSQ